MRIFRCVCLLFVLLSALQAAIIPAFSLEDLSRESETIVEGTVIRSSVGWDAKHTFVWTHYEVQVSDWLRGPGGRSIVVSEPGGTLEGYTYQGSGQVQYEIGEHVLLFLYTTPIGFVRSTGAGQGKLTITPEGRTRLNLAGLSFAGSAGPPGTSLASLEGQRIDAVKPAIRKIALSHPYKGVVR
jgi:hypothetical protein